MTEKLIVSPGPLSTRNEFCSGISIRPMRLDDIPAVQAIDQLSFSMPWPTKAYQYEINENPSSLLWVALATSPLATSPIPVIVGMIVVWLIVDEAHIATIAVHPDWRRQGIGMRLLETAVQEAFQKGMKTATLEVRISNLSAQALYQSFGFETVGVRPHYYKDNQEDAHIMTLFSLNRRGASHGGEVGSGARGASSCQAESTFAFTFVANNRRSIRCARLADRPGQARLAASCARAELEAGR